MAQILIVDDHAVVRHGLRQLLQGLPDITHIGEAQNAQEALQKARAQAWDLVMLDLTLPDKMGIEVLKELKRDCPKRPVLVLSMLPEDQYGVSVLKAGAAGYLPKESAPEELVTAVRKVLRGGKYVSLTLAEHLAFDLGPGVETPLHKTLSEREYQILCLLASGKTNSEVADQLALSPKTVSTYRSRILLKMKMRTNAELMNYSFRHKLVQ
jgi:two-component system, NarL family, invasion response regulator UvrY